jgi:hypothetical protein
LMWFQKPTQNLGMDYSQNITIDSQSSDSRMFHEVIISRMHSQALKTKEEPWVRNKIFLKTQNSFTTICIHVRKLSPTCTEHAQHEKSKFSGQQENPGPPPPSWFTVRNLLHTPKTRKEKPRGSKTCGIFLNLASKAPKIY